ncbi:MAG: PQQ-like beta-propeller repeat protein [Pirellulaceae bacterium]|nr:PQQ-like beta-propeller repeat protein [Pirellulaceae bacterium]
MKTPGVLVCLMCLWASAVLTAGDWPQWRGPQRNGISAEALSLDRWPVPDGPPVAWRAAVGKGHSALSIADGRAYTMGWDGAQDTLWCCDAADGRVLWRESYPSGDIKQWPGPRATPTVHNRRVYTLGLHGHLACFDARDGRLIWQVQLDASYNPDVDYGMAWSPLICDDLLVLGAGQRGLAIRVADGSFAWGNDGQHGACTSPVPYERSGQRGVVLVLANLDRDSASIVGVNPRSGDEYWRYATWPEKWGAICVDPVVVGNSIFVTSAETHLQGSRFSIRGNTLVEDWSNNKLSVYTGCCVYLDGFLYGVNKSGILRCLDWDRGEERWAQRGFGEHGSLMAADGKLLVQTYQTSELVLVEAAPDAYRELRRVKVFADDATSFTPPVLANGRIYCRSYDGEVVCLDLSAATRRQRASSQRRR